MIPSSLDMGASSVRTLAATALILLSAQTAWADCDELQRQGEAIMAVLTEAGDRYRPIAAEHLADSLQIKQLQPSVKAVAEAIPETEKMIEVMNKYFDHLISMKDSGCWRAGTDAQQSMLLAIFKGQRDQLVTDLKRMTEFAKQHH
jgi:hypothetical protein